MTPNRCGAVAVNLFLQELFFIATSEGDLSLAKGAVSVFAEVRELGGWCYKDFWGVAAYVVVTAELCHLG